MKNLRRLPVTDLARIAPLPRAMKYIELRKFGSFQPRKSYASVRRLLPMLYNWELPLLKLPQESWEKIENAIRSRSRPDFVESCVEVAYLLWTLNRDRKTAAREFFGPPFYIGPNHPVTFGIRHICIIDSQILFPFVQMRRNHGLDQTGLGILASMIREAFVFGDYASAGVEIIDFSVPRGSKQRLIRVYYGHELPQFSIDELNDMAFEVFDVIAQIEEEDS